MYENKHIDVWLRDLFVSNKNCKQPLTLLVSCYLAAAAAEVRLVAVSEAGQQREHLGTVLFCEPGILCCYPLRNQLGTQRAELKKMTVVPQLC